MASLAAENAGHLLDVHLGAEAFIRAAHAILVQFPFAQTRSGKGVVCNSLDTSCAVLR